VIKEPGEPQVSLALTPAGVSVTIQALLRGDGSDMHQDEVGAWVLGVWEKARIVAEVNIAYGLSLPTGPSPTIVGQAAPTSIPLPPSVEDPKVKLDGLIQRGVENGSLLPTKSSAKLPIETWRHQALELLRSRDGVQCAELRKIDTSLNRNTVQQRLYDLRAKGQAEFRHTGGAPSHGLWYAVETDGQDLVTSVLPYTRGKRFLMLGGRPNGNSKQDLENQLSLAELRWPDLEESDPIEWFLREIRKDDVDLLIVNRFNRRRSKQFLHIAQEVGKPFLCLTRGYGVRTVAAELKKQVIDKPTVELKIAA
jgi:hypothetical protein